MEKPEYALTRDDFETQEDWARYLHEGGFGQEIDGRGRLVPHQSRGHYSQLRNAIYGGEPGPANATRSGPSTTTGVTAYDAQKLYFAMAFAAWHSSYLNCHIVVTWSLVGVVADKDVATAHQRLMDLIRRWLQRGGSEGQFVWVIERGRKRGLHSHILLRMNPSEAFELRQWLYRAVARISHKDAVPKTTIFVRPSALFNGEAQWKFWGKYFLKGSDGTWLLRSLTHTKEGVFTGKRVGVSRSLDELMQRGSPDFPRYRASLRTIVGDPFDGRFDGGQFLVDLEREAFGAFPPGPTRG